MDELIRLAAQLGLAPIAVIITAVWRLWTLYSKQREAEHAAEIKIREEEVKAREKENELRRMQIRLDLTMLEFLKGAGHNVEIPDITQDII